MPGLDGNDEVTTAEKFEDSFDFCRGGKQVEEDTIARVVKFKGLQVAGWDIWGVPFPKAGSRTLVTNAQKKTKRWRSKIAQSFTVSLP